jgi:hypothetical protein
MARHISIIGKVALILGVACCLTTLTSYADARVIMPNSPDVQPIDRPFTTPAMPPLQTNAPPFGTIPPSSALPSYVPYYDYAYYYPYGYYYPYCRQYHTPVSRVPFPGETHLSNGFLLEDSQGHVIQAFTR